MYNVPNILKSYGLKHAIWKVESKELPKKKRDIFLKVLKGK